MTTQLTAGRPAANATRIEAACFTDGNEDEFLVEFWYLPGSIMRTVYNRRTTQLSRSWIETHRWEFGMLSRIAQAQIEAAFYAI